MDRNKILKMVVILAAVVVIATGLSRFLRRDSMSLSEYAKLNSPAPAGETAEPSREPSGKPDSAPQAPSANPDPDKHPAGRPGTPSPQPSATPNPDAQHPAKRPGTPSPQPSEVPTASLLAGASLNGDSQLDRRVLLEDGFYHEPLSDNLRRYITGVSFPGSEDGSGDAEPEITFDELRYVHILHYDFQGSPAEGELICNEAIAQDLVEIFYELYRSEYQLEKVLLIDEYDGDDNASMEDNNTSCFNYRPVEGSTHLSKHAYGLAVDINPLYNPYITYGADGSEKVQPASAAAYSDRSLSFPYKIDEEDLCCKLFLEHGFTWGGHWNNVKDYQHFQKAK